MELPGNNIGIAMHLDQHSPSLPPPAESSIKKIMQRANWDDDEHAYNTGDDANVCHETVAGCLEGGKKI